MLRYFTSWRYDGWWKYDGTEGVHFTKAWRSEDTIVAPTEESLMFCPSGLTGRQSKVALERYSTLNEEYARSVS